MQVQMKSMSPFLVFLKLGSWKGGGEGGEGEGVCRAAEFKF